MPGCFHRVELHGAGMFVSMVVIADPPGYR